MIDLVLKMFVQNTLIYVPFSTNQGEAIGTGREAMPELSDPCERDCGHVPLSHRGNQGTFLEARVG